MGRSAPGRQLRVLPEPKDVRVWVGTQMHFGSALLPPTSKTSDAPKAIRSTAVGPEQHLSVPPPDPAQRPPPQPPRSPPPPR